MQFSDTTNKNGLIQRCEDYAGLGDAGISGDSTLLKKFTGYINSAYHKVVIMILRSQDEWDFDDINHTDYPILTTDLVANQQDYTIPASEKVLKIKSLEVTYDGTNWYKATPLDKSELSIPTDTTTIGNNFSQTQPYYDIQYNAVFLYPIPDAAVTGGLKLQWTREIDEFTSSDTTQEPGIDEAFHPMLALDATLQYGIGKGLPNKQDLKNEWAEAAAMLANHYGDKQQDRQYILTGTNENYS